MRAASRLLATLARGEGAYLNARQPTGLTGVLTHPSPRPHLIYLYNETLRRLAGLPAHSVYRQATENLTRHRLQIVQSTVPDGLEEWRTRIAATVDQHGGWVKQLAQAMVDGKGYLPQKTEEADERDVEWNDEYVAERAEGPQEENDRLQAQQAKDFGEGITNEELGKQHVVLEDEPPLTADQYVLRLFSDGAVDANEWMTESRTLSTRSRPGFWKRLSWLRDESSTLSMTCGITQCKCLTLMLGRIKLTTPQMGRA